MTPIEHRAASADPSTGHGDPGTVRGGTPVADHRAILDELDELDRVEPGSDAEAAVYDRLRALVGDDV